MHNTSNLTQAHAPELAQQIRKTYRGQAHFAGSSLVAATCEACVFYNYWRQRRDRDERVTHTYRYSGCKKFHELTGKHGPIFPAKAEACRHFERKLPDNASSTTTHGN